MDLGASAVTQPNQTPNALRWSAAVGRREMSFVVERGTARTDG